MKRLENALIIALLLGTVAMPAAAEELAPGCVAAHAWVQANADRLPMTYEDIAGYPMTYRRAIFAAVPADAQSRLWRAHLARYLELHPELDAAGRAMVDEAVELTAPELFAAVDDPAAHRAALERLSGFGERARAVFAGGELRNAFFDLGALHAAAIQIEPRPRPAPECECAPGPFTNEPEACGENGHCDTSIECNNDSQAGCGLFTYIPCNGMCVPGAVVIDPDRL